MTDDELDTRDIEQPSIGPFTRDEIDAAEALFDSDVFEPAQVAAALRAVGNWRAAHHPILERFRTALSPIADGVDGTHVIATRLKRIPTMIKKLRRLGGRRFRLWDMQDIGGLRIIVRSQREASSIRNALVGSPPPSFSLVKENDYVSRPKASGYRCTHLVYSFSSSVKEDQRLNGLSVEVQIRSQPQHWWATASEVVGTLLRQDLKSGEGNPDWLRFFTLAGSHVAGIERLPLGANVPQDRQRFDDELSGLKAKLNVYTQITAFRVAEDIFSAPDVPLARHFVMLFNLETLSVRVGYFGEFEFEHALEAYRDLESSYLTDPNYDAVLVSADSIELLKAAYPNYFADTQRFLDLMYAAHIGWPG